MNGSIAPRLETGSRLLRLRCLNACTACYFRLAVPDRSLALIGLGIGLLEAPVVVEDHLLAPGERAECVLSVGNEGEFPLVSSPYDRGHDMSSMGHDMSGMGRDAASAHGHHEGVSHGGGRLGATQPISLMTIVARGAGGPASLPERLDPVPALNLDRAATTRSVVLSEDMTTDPPRFLLNGNVFSPDRIDFTVGAGTLELWNIVNDADMDDPFHIHVFPFQVIDRDGRPEHYRAWRDTVNVRPGERIRIAVPFDRFTGITMMHCHIVEHEDLGMMAMFAVA